MALPGHSPPPPFPIAGSPPRLLNGHPEHHFQPTLYNHRPLIPPSPQPFPRFQSITQTQMPHPASMYDGKGSTIQHPPVQNLHKRPGSSMSLSSILGTEPERQNREMPLFHNNIQSSEQGFGHASAPGMSVSAIMSPPQQPTRGGLGDFSYKRSQTPDRLETFAGNRQRSASSSAPMPPYRSIYEPQDRYAKPPTPQFHSVIPLPGPTPSREEHDERIRRTSLSGILQRPNSQPQASVLPPQFSRPYETLPPNRPNWYADPPPPMHEPPRTNGVMGTYDTKPPFRETPRSIANTQPPLSTPATQPPSPDIRRQSNGLSNRGLAGLLNGPTSQGPEHNVLSAQSMIRQASSQSHSDRSVFDERNRFRHFSPFTTNLDEQGRKSSEDIAHKTITGLSFENKRRYSPVPRAVQGAQAQTPVPDDGPRGDQGKVFSGIGGGLGNSTTPVPTTSSPFKKDDKLARSGEPSKTGKNGTSTGKRSRKAQDDDSRAEEQDNKKNGTSTKSNKKAKHQSYKLGNEETTGPTQRRGTPVANGLSNRANAASATGFATSTRYDTQPIFKPRKTVKVAALVSQTLRKPRKHLGTFRYEPIILVPECSGSIDAESEIRMKPKLLPSFSEAEDLNATFTVRVSNTWLHDRERRMVCSTRNLWGSGVYTDDSDPLAAAMHMGWIKPAFANVDEVLLQKIVHDQNPKVEISKELKPPTKPLELTKGRDLKITCVVMPLLERYEDTARFGLKSRAWPEVVEGAPHDGVSFSILKVELVDTGVEERRMGRTGQSKRARLHAQLFQRERATRLEKERVERMMKRIKERNDAQKQQQQERQTEKKKSPVSTTKAPSPLSKEVTMDDEIAQPSTVIRDGEEWIRQLATAAA